MKGTNTLMSAAGYGKYEVVVEALGFGINIIANEAAAKTRRAFYPWKRTSSSFGVTMVFHPYADFTRFYRWFHGYSRRLADPDGKVGPMRVQFPSRGFDRTGVPRGSWTTGDSVEEFVYRMTIAFIGARDPADLTNTDLVSHFLGPDVNRTPTGETQNLAAPYYYPAGIQLSEREQGEDYLYNHPRLATEKWAGKYGA